MKQKKATKLIRATVASLGLAACGQLQAIDYAFSQGGFAEGATVSGSFSGEDTDGNGFLNHFVFDGVLELTDFSLSFSGNSLVEAFTLDFDDLEMFSFMLGGDGEIGNDVGDVFVDPYQVEGISAFDGRFSFVAGTGPTGGDGAFVDDFDLFGSDSSAENPVAAGAERVPDGGSTAAILAASLASLAALRRRGGAPSGR